MSVPCSAKERQQQEPQNRIFCFCCVKKFSVSILFFFFKWLFFFFPFSKFYQTDLACCWKNFVAPSSEGLTTTICAYCTAKTYVTPMQTSQTKTVGVGFRGTVPSQFFYFFFLFSIFFSIFHPVLSLLWLKKKTKKQRISFFLIRWQ